MRRVSAPLIAVTLLICGCGRSPQSVFGVLKDAAIRKDAPSVWANITPETQIDLAQLAAAQSQSAPPGGAAGLAYLTTLTAELSDQAIEYIKSLRPGQVTVTGDVALMSIGSYRYGSTQKALVFRRVDKKWLWDARDILKAYIENRDNLEAMGGL